MADNNAYLSVYVEDCVRGGHHFKIAGSDKTPLKRNLICVTCSERTGKSAYAAYGRCETCAEIRWRGDSGMSDDKHGIIELLTRIGEDNIRLQNLVESATNFATRRHGETAVTFLTDQINCGEIAAGTPRNVGLVLWLPAAAVREIQEHWTHEKGSK